MQNTNNPQNFIHQNWNTDCVYGECGQSKDLGKHVTGLLEVFFFIYITVTGKFSKILLELHIWLFSCKSDICMSEGKWGLPVNALLWYSTTAYQNPHQISLTWHYRISWGISSSVHSSELHLWVEYLCELIRLNRLSPHVLPFRFHLLASIRARSIKEIPGGEMQTGVLKMHL